MSRLPWGHKSRHCVYCGKVGPRCIVAGGYAHKYCIPKTLKRKRFVGVDDGKPRTNTDYGTVPVPPPAREKESAK